MLAVKTSQSEYFQQDKKCFSLNDEQTPSKSTTTRKSIHLYLGFLNIKSRYLFLQNANLSVLNGSFFLNLPRLIKLKSL